MAGKLPQSSLRSPLPGNDRSQKREMAWRSCTTPGARHGPMGLASQLLPTGLESYRRRPPPGQAIKSNNQLNIITIKYDKMQPKAVAGGAAAFSVGGTPNPLGPR